MDELFESCPPMDLAALEEEILGGPLADDNYLFYRSGQADSGWPDADGKPGTMWELHCTACHQPFFEPKRRGFRVSALTSCPQCGAAVAPKRWQLRRTLETRILYFKFQRGEGRQIWLRAYWVVHNFCPSPGDERLEFFEAARYRFADGEAQEWSRAASYFGQERLTVWRRRTRVAGTKWHVNAMSCYSEVYPMYFGEVDSRELQGSCLEYSQLRDAISAGFDLPEYLDFYVRNPMIEYLWKFGLDHLLWEALAGGRRKEFRQAVNLRAKRPKDLLRGLTVSEVQRIRADGAGLGVVRCYQKLKRDGIVTGDTEGWTWAQAVAGQPEAVEWARRYGVDGRALRGYIGRQSRRSGRPVRSVLSDHGDYLRQIAGLGNEGGELFPQDLQAAHERLSERQRRLLNRDQNRWFRIRRRLCGWMRWRHDGYLIRPVDSADEIIAEGERQRNCVADYASRHISGKTVILVLRRRSEPGKSWHTVELNPSTLDVRQCRGFRNADAEPEAAEFIEAWTARLKSLRLQNGRHIV